jgi:hypothetical protein
MNITKLASKPQLIQLTLDDEDTIEKYGEPLDFHIWDKQPLEKFVEMATVGQEDYAKIISYMKTAILDDSGEPVCKDDMVLPPDVMMKAMNKVVETLGK